MVDKKKVRGFNLGAEDLKTINRVAVQLDISDSAALRMIIREWDEAKGSKTTKKEGEREKDIKVE